MYGVHPDNFRKTWITCRRLFGEVAWLKSFYSALCLQILLLQLFPPISHLICRSRSAVYLSLMTLSILSYSDFVKSLSKARKSLTGFRKLFRRSLPWPGLDEYEVNSRLSKAKYKKQRRRRPIREISTQMLPSPIGRRIGEWPARECQGTRSGPWRVGQHGLRCSPENGEALKEVGREGEKTVFLGDKEGAIQDVWGSRSDGGRDPLPVWDNVFTVWEATQGRRESWPPSFSLRRPPIRTEMGVREIALWRISPRRSGGNKSAAWSAWRNYNCFFIITIFQKSSGHNSYIKYIVTVNILVLEKSTFLLLALLFAVSRYCFFCHDFTEDTYPQKS